MVKLESWSNYWGNYFLLHQIILVGIFIIFSKKVVKDIASNNAGSMLALIFLLPYFWFYRELNIPLPIAIYANLLFCICSINFIFLSKERMFLEGKWSLIIVLAHFIPLFSFLLDMLSEVIRLGGWKIRSLTTLEGKINLMNFLYIVIPILLTVANIFKIINNYEPRRITH